MGFLLAEMSGFTEIMKDRKIWKCLLAEFLGTLVLVFVGCGSCLNWDGPSGPGPSITQISLTFGLTVATMAQAIGHVSGCHINPAVTTGMLVANKMKPIKAALYVIFQCLGAISGAAILKAFTPEEIQGSLGMTVPNKEMAVAQALGVEFVITLILVLTVFGVCDGNRDDIKGSAPLAIGLSITACHLAAIKFTGSSMNPARTFGPAVVTSIWTEHWLYWMGPCGGGAVAGLLYRNAFQAAPARPDEGNCEYEPCAKGDKFQEEAAV
ncbi:aquaporin AQPAe.a [Folsomia candida]|uniref:Aquaporin AQPAe.a n=1 Tax=Folsomia candida TaxID=158441 RepID=A0A226EY58_FOLCA|nr:aquaporin AQPAe.a [Folsomia candida]XP_021951110.1 aquaporin AQPAe.a [Folsomia candida]XP_035701926.1 aquaporin AQPAe.a [Folsomia candida]OXA61536.1 Aquaporin AQPAe.a [Folsomia candida]